MTRWRQTGVTLVEMMVTVAIVAILAMAAWPSFQSTLTRSRLRGAAETLAQDLQLARSQSIKDSCPITVSFTAGVATAWSYRLTKPSSPTGCLNPCTPGSSDCTLRTVLGTEYKDIVLAHSPTKPFTGDSITYDPVRSMANTGAVILSASTGDAVQIELSTVGGVSLCTSSGSSGYSAC